MNPRMRKKKQSFELRFEQTEMLGRFGDASLDYPKLSFKLARAELATMPREPRRYVCLTAAPQLSPKGTKTPQFCLTQPNVTR
jgi:hypothetical protein